MPPAAQGLTTINGANSGLFTAAIPVTQQIANYLSSTGGVANPNALYLISSGGNDVTFALNKAALRSQLSAKRG